MTTINTTFDLGLEEAETFDAPLDAVDFALGIAAGVAAGCVVVLIAT